MTLAITLEPDLRYPVGLFTPPADYTPDLRRAATEIIAQAPTALRAAVRGLTNEQLDTPYRPGGWSLRQVTHHLPDSHMNAYIRLRLALTEENPTIKPYEESRWAELADAKSGPVEHSLALMDSLHARWVALLRSLPIEAFSRLWTHPEHGELTVDWHLQQYAWHCRHHVAQITGLRRRMGWH